jgi:hypothetical protein
VTMPNPDEKDIVDDEKPRAHCADCGRPYGDEYGFPDLVVSDDVWAKISGPTGNGLLCPSCLCHRSHNAGVKNAVAVFRSGPFVVYDIVDETAAVVERLRAAYTSWNNPPSDGLPEGAEVVLEAADLLERLSRERGTVPEGWHDISTAPKDGTWVVLFGPHSRHGVDAHIICRWDGDYWQSSDDGYGAYIQATHWMPLPPRPGDRTDSGEAQDGSLNQTSINASPKPEGE